MHELNEIHIMNFTDDGKMLFSYQESKRNRGVNGGWAGMAIVHPGFGRIEGATGQQRHAELLLAHPALGTPCDL